MKYITILSILFLNIGLSQAKVIDNSVITTGQIRDNNDTNILITASVSADARASADDRASADVRAYANANRLSITGSTSENISNQFIITTANAFADAKKNANAYANANANANRLSITGSTSENISNQFRITTANAFVDAKNNAFADANAFADTYAYAYDNRLSITGSTSENISNQFIITTADARAYADAYADTYAYTYADAYTYAYTYDNRLSITGSTSENISNQFRITTANADTYAFANTDAFAFADTNAYAYDNRLSITDNVINIDANYQLSNDFYATSNQFRIITANAYADANSYTNTNTNTNAFADAFALANNNTLSITDNVINIDANHQLSNDFYATSNQFRITTGTANANANAKANASISVKNTKIDTNKNTLNYKGTINSGDIYAGHVEFKLKSGNEVQNNNSSRGHIDIHNTNINITNNIINFSETAKTLNTNSSLYGGYLDFEINGDTDYTNYVNTIAPGVSGNITYDIFTGNSLVYSSKNISNFKNIENFHYYKFILNPSLANSNTPIIHADNIVFGSSIKNMSNHDSSVPINSEIIVLGIHSGNILQAGDKFILINSDKMTGNVIGSHNQGIVQLQQGISFIYDVKTIVDMANKEVIAVIESCKPSNNCIDNKTSAYKINPQLKSLSEGNLALSQLIMRGADMISGQVFSKITSTESQSEFIPFGIISGQYNRYDSGSYINSKDWLMTTGLSYRNNNMIFGVFIEGGQAKYTTHNNFDNAKNVKGDGDAKYFGLGLLAHYKFDNNVYTEGSVRLGHSRNKFHTDDIKNFSTNELVKYSINQKYATAHVGLGYILPLNEENSLDLSAKYLWGTISGKNINVAGDSINFKRINSNRIRLNIDWNYQYNNNTMLFAGMGYEYNTGSKAKATTQEIYNINAPNIKGDTGFLSFGATIQPSQNKNLSLDLKVEGYIGKRRGGKGNIAFRYAL